MLLAAGAKGRNSILPAKRRNHLRSRTAGSCKARYKGLDCALFGDWAANEITSRALRDVGRGCPPGLRAKCSH